MTVSEARNALLALNREGMAWDEIAHRINVMVGDRRVITMDTIRRFAVERRAMRPASFYWAERWLEARASASAEVSR